VIRPVWSSLVSPLPGSIDVLRGWASAPDFVGRALSATYVSNRRRMLKAVAIVIAMELAVALPFAVINPASVRGVPGPLLIVISLTGAFLLGIRAGVPLVALAVVLAVVILGEDAAAEPIVWIPVGFAIGWLGDEVRRGEALRRSLVTELHEGLIALSREPVVHKVRIITRYIPAQREQILAGDFYGVLGLEGGRVATLVGDVSGHGPQAAATATHLRAAWRALASSGASPVRTARVLNESLLAEQTGSEVRFATLSMAWFDPDLETVSVISAGHPPPLLLTRRLVQELRLRREPPIGIVREPPWREQRVRLPAEAWSMLFFTDGLVEGRTTPGGPRPFGTERLVASSSRLSIPLGEQSINWLLDEVHQANGEPMRDDIVIVAVSPVAAYGA
jgi:hypothetical protein